MRQLIPFFYYTIAFVNVATVVPNVFNDKILEGQIIKQTFSAEMARGFLTGDLIKSFYPPRHFVEVFHPLPVAWAEEFPLYTATVGWLGRVSSVELVVVGRLLSFLGFICLLGAAYTFSKIVFSVLDTDEATKKEVGWMGVCLASGFPVFRIYATTVMPDLWMVAVCFWAWIFAWRKKWLTAGLVGAIACLLKYYAVFSILGLFLYRLGKEKQVSRAIVWSVLTVAPAVAYLFMFIYQQIPNPITDYVFWNGGGHMGLTTLARPIFYSRMITWSIVKNPGLIFGLSSLWGFLLLLRQNAGLFIPPMVLFLFSQWVAGLIFMTIFSPTYLIHDYYGLQWALLTLVFAQIAFVSVRHFRYPLIGLGCLAGMVMTWSATTPQRYYEMAAQLLTKQTEVYEDGLFVSDRAGEVPLFLANRSAWLARVNQWHGGEGDTSSKMHKYYERRFRQAETKWVGVLLVGDHPDARMQAMVKEIASFGWEKTVVLKNWKPHHTKDSAASFALLRRR